MMFDLVALLSAGRKSDTLDAQIVIFSQEDEQMQLPDPLIIARADVLGGTPVFAGTRVPVKALFDHLEAGDTIDEFLHQFPTVSREHATAVLKLAGQRVLRSVGKAA